MSDFEALLTTRGGERALLVAFDLLRLDGRDIRENRLEDRRQALKRPAPASAPSSPRCEQGANGD
jgi:ATP-dependent DNA ligase